MWLPAGTIPDSALVAIATDHDGVFGLLHSRIHEVWSLAMGSFIGVGNDARYTPDTTFDTFPFPRGFRREPPESVAEAARSINEARERWLNPEGAESGALKTRTLTMLYNEREAGRATWLNGLHRNLDQAVLESYGWGDLADPLFAAEDALRLANPQGDALGLALSRTEPGQDLLRRLLALNFELAGCT